MDRKTVDIIKQALLEDAVDQDVTSLNLINKEQILSGSFIVKSTGVVSGIDVVKEVYRQINPKIKLDILRDNGSFVNRGDVIASIEGPMRDILRGERVALNFLQRMSGIAAITAKYLQEIVGTNAQLMDTRNTTPLLRGLERQAVNDAKGLNEHLNLSDQVVITSNHIATLGGIKNAVVEARKQGLKVGLIRPITLWPFPSKVLNETADKVKGFISVELSMGQMIEDVRLATNCKKPVVLCNRSGGMIPTPEQVLESIQNLIKETK